MKLPRYFITFIIFSFCSCSQQDSSSFHLNVVEIAARDEGSPQTKDHPIIYRVKVPRAWSQQNPPLDESLVDTTKAIAEFYIIDGHEKIRIAIHNFPSNSMGQRIPPMAQVSRWKKQFQSINQASLSIQPQAFGGYSGFLIEATGEMHGVATTMLGWALQLASEHFRALSRPVPQILTQRYRQMRGDVTIKAVGPQQLMDKYREDIIAFARSFQLIDDIP